MAYNMFKLNNEGLPRLLAGIQSKQEWEQKQQELRDMWIKFIRGLPEPVPVAYQVIEEVEEADHKRIHLAYDTVYGDRVTAYLLLPTGRAVTNGAHAHTPRPAVLALHPTHESGKNTVALQSGKESHRYGLELVSRGYVVLAPDALTAGERTYAGQDAFNNTVFYEQYPEWTSVAKNIVDHRQGVDLLCSLEEVNCEALGVIGHSFGGYNAYFLAGVDERIKAVVSSCGFSPFYRDHRPTHWGVRGWFTHLPEVTQYLSRYEVPFEFHEIASLVAPVPFFNYFAQNDHIFTHWQAIAECFGEVYTVYDFLDVGERFESVMGVKGHDFPQEIRQLAYRFLDHWLIKNNLEGK